MTDQAFDEKYYPYWEEVYILLKAHGYKFTADYDSAYNHPCMQVDFVDGNEALAAIALLQSEFDPNIVYNSEVFDVEDGGIVWIDQLPQWYPVSPDELRTLLKDMREFLWAHGDDIFGAGSEVAGLINRINEVLPEVQSE